MKGIEHYKPRSHLSVSSLLAFDRCPRKFFYQSGCRLEGLFEPNYFSFGTAIHKAAPLALLGKLDESLIAFASVWEEENADEKRNQSRGHEMLMDLHERFSQGRGIFQLQPPPPTSLEIDDAVSDYEIAWAIDIGLRVPLVGRTDSWAIRLADDTLWTIEYKTSSEVSTRLCDGLEFSPQPCLNVLALRTLSGLDIKGTIYVILRVSKANTETMVHPVYVQPHHLQDNLLWAQDAGARLLACEDAGIFPKNPSACTPYNQFGQPGFKCEYSSLCHLTDDWTEMLGNYHIGSDRPFILSKEATVAKA